MYHDYGYEKPCSAKTDGGDLTLITGDERMSLHRVTEIPVRVAGAQEGEAHGLPGGM